MTPMTRCTCWVLVVSVFLNAIVIGSTAFGRLFYEASVSVHEIQSESESVGDIPKFVKKLSSCSCETDAGIVDLSPLDSRDPANPKFSVQSSSDTILYNPCTPINKDLCTDAALCDKFNTFTTIVGKQDTATFGNTGTGGMLAVTYTNAWNTGTVTLNCDPKTVAELTVQTLYSPYKLTLTSKYACPGSGSGGGGLSIGSILLIIAIVLLFVYLVGGIIFMRFYRQATGVDMIPNASFWREVPSLIQDGTRYTVSTLTNSKLPQKGGYENM